VTSQEPENPHFATPDIPDTEVISVAAPAPVFVDSTGRRSRRLRRLAYAFGALVMLYGGLISVSLAGGPVRSSAVLPLPGLVPADDAKPPPRTIPTPAPAPSPTSKPLFVTEALPRRATVPRRPAPRLESTRITSRPVKPKPIPSRTPKPATTRPVESTTVPQPSTPATVPSTTPPTSTTTTKPPAPPAPPAPPVGTGGAGGGAGDGPPGPGSTADSGSSSPDPGGGSGGSGGGSTSDGDSDGSGSGSSGSGGGAGDTAGIRWSGTDDSGTTATGPTEFDSEAGFGGLSGIPPEPQPPALGEDRAIRPILLLDLETVEVIR
jgi:hypothetical protein